MRAGSGVYASILVGVLSVALLAGCGGGGGSTSTAETPPGKTFGGAGNDYGFSVRQTADGGYIIVGATNSKGSGGYDAYLLKTNAAGTTTYESTFGDTGNDIAYDIQQTTDGGYIITGVYNVANSTPTPPFPGDLVGELFLRKLDANFSLLWEKKFSDNINAQHECLYALGYALQQTTDGGYVAAGSCAYNVGGEYPYVLRLDSSGNTIWEFNNLLDGGFSNTGNVNAVRQTADGGFIVTISTYLVKLNSSGQAIWVQETDSANTPIGGTAQAIWDLAGGDYVITGVGNFDPNTGLAGDLYLAKYSTNGTLLWEKTYGSSGGDEGFSIQETADNGIVSVGRGSMINNHGFDAYLVRTDADGNLQWQKSFGGVGDDAGRSVRQTSDGGYILVGYTTSKGAGGYDIYLVKTDANGNSIW